MELLFIVTVRINNIGCFELMLRKSISMQSLFLSFKTINYVHSKV